MTKYFAALLMVLVAWPSLAADLNGYTAQYECRAGGANCNVDVATLTSDAAHPCQQTITTSTTPTTDWSAINWNNTYICIQAGDHTGRGTLTIGSSGTSSQYKVLRYTRASDGNDEPWNQGSNQAKIAKISITGKSYWIIHRLTFPAIDQALSSRIVLTGSSENHIVLNRILIEGMQSGFTNIYSGVYVFCCGTDSITVQNSVIRNSWGKAGTEPMGIEYEAGTNMHIVNNEIYNWSAHPVQIGRNQGPQLPGAVLENNDLYVTSTMYTSGGLARTKANVSWKSYGSSSAPQKIIHNRIWGGRGNDLSVCCIVGDKIGGVEILAVVGGTPYSYILVQNNIIGESQDGLVWANGSDNNQSVIGNIFYNMANYTNNSSYYSHALYLDIQDRSEVYLNTFVNNGQGLNSYGMTVTSASTNSDIRCNVFLTSGANQNSVSPSGTIADYQVFYDSTAWSIAGTNTKISKSVSTRANSTAYSLGQILRTAPPANCVTGSESACFLYKVTQAGTSAGSAPAYCAAPGCMQVDGGMQAQAIRSPYVFKRKLRTVAGGENAVIPYVRLHSSAPETYTCPSGYASRTGIGINDTP